MDESDEILRAVSEAERASSEAKYELAERALRRALRLQEAHFGPVHPEVANTLNDLGVVCDILGRPNEAEFLYRRALGLARRTLPADHPYIATSLENLSTLYRAQGKAEKLAKLGELEMSRSGLPPTDSADDAEEADASDGVEALEEVAVGTGVVHEAEPVVPSGSGALDRTGSRSAQLTQPAMLVATALAVLLGVGWLLFGGGSGDEAPQPDAGPQATALDSGEPETIGDPDLGPETEPDILVPTLSIPPENADTPNPELAETGSPGSEPAPEPPIEAPLEEPGFTVDAGAVVVVEAGVCSRLVTQGEDGRPLGDWRCDPVGDVAGPGPVYFYTRIRSPADLTVQHRWLRDGALDHDVDLQVGANTGRGYRTYSTRTVLPGESGVWRLELRVDDREPLRVEEFVVR